MYSDIAVSEKSVDTVTVVFFKSIDPPTTTAGEVDKPFTADVQVYKDESSTYSFSWTKDGKAYSTFSNRSITLPEVIGCAR